MASLKVALLALFSVALMFSPSQSAVFSVDLGSESVKVAVVNLKPGQSPICIAINEMSKRKSPALVSFHDGDRLLGEEAAGLAARYPQKVYSQMRDLIAKPYASGQRILNSMYLPFQTKEDSRGGVSFQSENDDAVYSPEELVAMVLGYAANLAEFHAKIPIKDAVIAVPPHMGQAERRGLLAAAQLAGINVLSLINEHSGAALQYGIDKDFSNESRHVIFYDMGASSSYAALVYFSAYKGKEYGKSVSVNQFQVKDVRWNPELGGQHMELRLVEYFADQFNAHVGGGIDVRKFPKAMAKLKKQVKRTKEILSANTAAPISVESLLDDVDFSGVDWRCHQSAKITAYESDNYLPPGVTSPEIAQYQISGLTDASQKYSSRNLSSPIKANIHFSLSRSGILSLDRADAVIEITEWVEVPRKNLTIENSTISSNVSAESAAGNSTEENNESVQTDSGVNKASNISAEEQAATEPATEKKLKRQTFRVPLKIVEKITGFGMSLSQDFLAEAKRKLQVLDQKDADRKRTAELKNNLEGYIYTTKEKIETLEEFEKVSTSEERQSFIEKLDQVQDWLYTDGEDANATEFQEHLDQLKAVGDPIFFRLKELTTRPAAVEHAHKYIDELKQIVQEWKAKKPWLPQERVDEVIKSSEKLKNWLDEKEAEQKKTSGFSKPAFTSEEVYLKVLDLQTKVASINRIPKPKPKVQKPVKNETESSSAQNTETSDSNSADSSSSSDSSANSSEGTSKETVTEQSEGHDEL
ncbi:Heat shock protein 17 [Glycine soja]